MNEAAFDFLEMLLRILAKRRELQLVNYKDLAKSFTGSARPGATY
jgi:hypothetical protein